ncbi:PREDICTED: fractalkine isoform X2 [Myotis brandtii]|nr:PREDICTED: fractalkine isoform X2 [Myotis brandtii]
MTSEIPRKLLASYRRTEASCRTPAIILKTNGNRELCADPKEDWVKKAMEHLDRKAAPFYGNKAAPLYGMQTDPRIPPSTRGTDRSPASEPTATAESSSQVARGPSETSPKLPQGVTDSWGNMSAPTSPAPDGGPSGGPERTELFSVAAATTATSTATTTTATTATTTTTTTTTATSWQSSYQPTVDLGTEGKAFETPSTQAPSTQAPTISHTAPDHGQDLMPGNPLGSSSAHTDAITGPGSTPRVSVAPSREPVATGSWAPTPKNPQRLGILSTPVTEATRRQAVGLLAFLGLLFCLGVAMFTYQRLQGCPRSAVGDMVEGLRYVPRGCGSNSYVLVPV